MVARAAAQIDQWRLRLPAAQPRLFFDAAGWAGLGSRYARSKGQERMYFDAVLARAAKLAAMPTPPYRTPAQVTAADGTTPFEAAQELWQRPIGNAMVSLALSLALGEDSKVRTKLRDLILAVCRYPQWGTPGPNANRDLAAGHLSRGIAVAVDWHPDLLDAAERRGVLAVITERVNCLAAAAYGGNFWAGKYEENHDHVGVCGIGLCGLAFLDETPDAAEWTALALDNFEHVAAECSPDGTSPEGVPYWSYGMSYTLQYIEGVHAVLGTRAFYDKPYFKNSINARMHASTPDLSGIVPWGDAPRRDYYGPHHILYRLASQYRDGFGQFLAEHLPFRSGEGDSMDDGAWTALWYDPTLQGVSPSALDHHADASGLIFSRTAWTDDAALLCFKAGFTNRNHGHLDAGAIAYCRAGDWLLRTPGYGHGKGESAFWDGRVGRWTFFSNSTESHCTLVVDGQNQLHELDSRGRVDAFAMSGDWVRFGADLTGAYGGVRGIRRDVLRRRGAYVLVFDRVTADRDVVVEWLAQTPPDAQATDDGLHTRGGGGTLRVRPLVPASATFAVRRPRAPHVDVDAKQLKTYALAQTGRDVRYVVALLENEAVQCSADATGFTLSGDQWSDRVTIDDAPGVPIISVATRTGDVVRSIQFDTNAGAAR